MVACSPIESSLSHVIMHGGLPCDTLLVLPMLVRLAEHLTSDESQWYQIRVIGAHSRQGLIRLAVERGLAEWRSRITLETSESSKLSGVDTVYCVDRSYRAGFAAWRTGARHRVGFSSGAASVFYNQLAIRKWNNSYPEIERNLDLLRMRWQLPFAAWDANSAGSLLAQAGFVPRSSTDPAVLITIASKKSSRCWPVEHVSALCERLVGQGVEVWLVGDSLSSPVADAVQKLVPSLLVKNLCQDRSDEALVDLIATASLVVSTEMLTLYVASDLKIPLVALHAASVADAGFGPWRRNASAVGVVGLRCVACDDEVSGRPAKRSHCCATDITGERVYREARRLVEFLL